MSEHYFEFETYGDELRTIDQKKIHEVIVKALEMEVRVNRGEDVTLDELMKLNDQAMKANMFGSPIEVSGMLRPALTDTFKEINELSEHLESIPIYIDDDDPSKEYRPIVQESMVLELIQLRYNSETEQYQVVFPVQPAEEFEQDPSLVSELMMLPSELFEYTPKYPSAALLLEQFKHEHPDAYLKIQQTIPTIDSGPEEVLEGLRSYAVYDNEVDVDNIPLGDILMEHIGFTPDHRYDMHINGIIYSLNADGEEITTYYQGKLSSARVVLIGTNNEDWDDGRFTPVVALAVEKNGEVSDEDDGFQMISMPVASIEDIRISKPNSLGFTDDEPATFASIDDVLAYVSSDFGKIAEQADSRIAKNALAKLAKQGLIRTETIDTLTQPTIAIKDDMNMLWNSYMTYAHANTLTNGMEMNRAQATKAIDALHTTVLPRLRELAIGDHIEVETAGAVLFDDVGGLQYVDEMDAKCIVRGTFSQLASVPRNTISEATSYTIGMYLTDVSIQLDDMTRTASDLEQGLILPIDCCYNEKKVISV